MKTVTAVDGRVWRVRRRWLPRHHGLARRWLERRRVKRGLSPDASWWDVAVLPGDLDDFFWLAVIVAGIALLFFFGVPLVLAIVDLVIVLLLVVVGVLARVVLRRPWTVEATGGDHVIERQVVGWRRAGEEVALLAHEIEHGRVQ